MEMIEHCRERFPHWRTMATLGIFATACVCVYLAIRRVELLEARELEKYNHAIKALDPKAIEQWKAATNYQKMSTDLRAFYAPKGVWGPRVPLQELLERVKTDPQWANVAKAAGYSIDEMVYQVVCGRIPAPGLSPIPVLPGSFWPRCFLVAQLAVIGAVTGKAIQWISSRDG
ncbi:MAG: hypothetical protein JSR80_03535 [Verrucomicrobia bacterium]|nr:hypothetical protein [Verrucomicrobiota bacterium]